MKDIEDLAHILFNSRLNTCRCGNKTVFLETPVDIFGEAEQQRAGNFKSAWIFLNWVRY